MSGENDAGGHVIAARYELMDVIGRGGYSLVFRARDRLSGDVVAVKMLSDVAARDPQQVERLRREQQALARLSGTGTVKVIDLCPSASGKLCLVMEWLDGVDLEQRLQQLEMRGERMTPEELLAIVGPLVDTLDRAHGAGILHRDLKPANVFLLSPAAGSGVRLLDFGLARMRRANPLTSAGSIMGSPSYIAPEVWKGRSDELDQRVDVYSLGVIVFVALGGRLPFDASTLEQKFVQTTSAPRPSLRALRPDLPVDLDVWVEEILAIDPEQRFSSVRAAGAALVAALGLMPRPAITPDRIVQIGGEIRARAISEGEKSFISEWLAKSDLRLERPLLPTPPPPAAEFEEVPAPLSVRNADSPGGERSLVSEWLQKSDLELGREEPLEEITTWRPPRPDAPAKAVPHPRPPSKRAPAKPAKAKTPRGAKPLGKPQRNAARAAPKKARPKPTRTAARTASRSKVKSRATNPKKARARSKPKKTSRRR
jgi:eukaryotic-like serine/threonine-protein kinase